MVSGLAWIRTAHSFVDENGVTLRGWIDSEDLKLWEPDARVQLAVGNAKVNIDSLCEEFQDDRTGLTRSAGACRRELAPVQGTRRLQRVRLFPRSFVLYRPWIPGEHRRGICAVECVTAHLRGFEEDSRSEVVFWIDEWSIEFGFTGLILLMFMTIHLFQLRFAYTEQYFLRHLINWRPS